MIKGKICTGAALFLAVQILFGTAWTFAEPVTLYKAKNVAIARENAKRHPWAKEIVDSWKRSAESAMSLDADFFDRMLSTVTPWPEYGQSCPACVGKQSTMGETGHYEWNINDPDRLRCRYCGTVYPNPEYPETGSMTAKRMGQTFTFYRTDEERRHPDDTSGKYAFRWASWPVHTSWSGIIRYKKAAWCIGQVLPLAKLYAITGETKYAERAALIMDKIARVYPHWLYHSYNGTYADCPGGEAAAEMGKNPPAGKFPVETIITAFPGLHTRDGYAVLNNGFWGGGRFGCSGTDAGMILNMAVAYDLIHEVKRSGGAPVFSPEAEKRIVNDLILAGCADSENYDEINNKCGPSRSLSGAVGILFRKPESVRRSLAGFEALMEKSFHFDGFCEESPSYSDMHLSLMRNIPEILLGYSDQPGYRPADGKTLKNFDPFRSVGRYQLALESMVRMLDCNRKYPVIGDTHYGSGISPIYAEILADRYNPAYAGLLEEAQGAPLAEKGSEYALWYRDPGLKADGKASLPLRSEWFPGWQVGVLRGGDAGSNTNLYFNGYAQGGHRHRDTLGIAYSAFGKELMSDRGYMWDDPRNAWTGSTLAHNLVTVDGENQNGENRHSTLELFAASPAVEVIQASANAYSQCDEYRRTTVLVKLPDGGSYMVDFFRVQGGKKHQYSFHCNGNPVNFSDAALQAGAEEIKWLSNIRDAAPRFPVNATWEHDGVKLDVKVLNELNGDVAKVQKMADRFLVADAPGWRTSKGVDLNAKPITQCIIERSHATRAISQFVTLSVPYTGDKSPIAGAGLTVHGASKATGLSVMVSFRDGRKDYIISSPDQTAKKYGPVSMTGAFGYISLDARGNVVHSLLADGTSLQHGNLDLRLPEPHSEFRVASAEGRTFHLEKPVLPGTVKPGAFLLAGETGYEIESVKGAEITVRDYPALACETIRVINTASR
ncbi:MAG: heparinase II/III domain-containing protein [Candidatus Latescibacterota bacterium]